MTATLKRPVSAERVPPRLPPRRHPDGPDDLVVLALRSMSMFPSALRLARHLGPELFQDPAARLMASGLITGIDPPDPGPRLRAHVAALVSAVTLASVPAPDDPQYGVHLVRQLAEREHLPILIETLTWAAWAAGERQPLPYVLRRVVEAFAAAMGTRPLDARLREGAETRWRR